MCQNKAFYHSAKKSCHLIGLEHVSEQSILPLCLGILSSDWSRARVKTKHFNTAKKSCRLIGLEHGQTSAFYHSAKNCHLIGLERASEHSILTLCQEILSSDWSSIEHGSKQCSPHRSTVHVSPIN